MATTTTLLGAVNRVLLDVGERQVNSVSNPASRKAKAYLQDAFQDMQIFHDWGWLNNTVNADTWSNEKATITNARRIKQVKYRFSSNTGFIEIPFCSPETFYPLVPVPYSGATSTFRPYLYTILSSNVIAINPYPTDVTNRAKIFFDIVQYYDPPSSDDDVFNGADERFVNILVRRAVFMMLHRHLGDANAAGMIEGEFRDLLDRYRSQEARVPSEGTNMFRPRRSYYWR